MTEATRGKGPRHKQDAHYPFLVPQKLIGRVSMSLGAQIVAAIAGSVGGFSIYKGLMRDAPGPGQEANRSGLGRRRSGLLARLAAWPTITLLDKGLKPVSARKPNCFCLPPLRPERGSCLARWWGRTGTEFSLSDGFHIEEGRIAGERHVIKCDPCDEIDPARLVKL